MDSTRLNEAPTIVWQDGEDVLEEAMVGTLCIGSVCPSIEDWGAGVIWMDVQNGIGSESEAKQWVETQWQEFWAKIHEVEG